MTRDGYRLLKKLFILGALMFTVMAARPARMQACEDWVQCFGTCFSEFANCVTYCQQCEYCDHNDCDLACTQARNQCEWYCNQNACQ